MKYNTETYLDRTARQCHVTVTLIIDTVWGVMQDIHHIVKRAVDELLHINMGILTKKAKIIET